MTDQPAKDQRLQEVEANLSVVRQRIAAACENAGRPLEEVRLIAVTKFFPATDVRILAELGVWDIGENRDQEAREKFADPILQDLLAPPTTEGPRLTTHFIGQLQSNKAASVTAYADVIHTVDRAKLVGALERAAVAAGRSPSVLIQVSLDDEPGRGGAAPDEARRLADLVAESTALDLAGVMAVAPLGGDPDAAFSRLATVAHGIREAHPDATWVSAGMSGDLEAAIRHGATHLRVGSAILGSRPTVR